MFVFEAFLEKKREDLLVPHLGPWFMIGAQGPDIFYHNQRTKPSGIALGSLLHRKSYGDFCAILVANCLEKNFGPDSPLGAYTLGFISHGILDRFFHPFINYFAGWHDPTDPSTEPYRYAHSFFERIIDNLVAERDSWVSMTKLWSLGVPGSAEANFGSLTDLGPSIPAELHGFLLTSLQEVFPKNREDSLLSQRLSNAYKDARGFYLYADSWEISRARDFQKGDLRALDDLRWTGLLHPPVLPSNTDFENKNGQSWIDPCGFGEWTQDSLWDLWGQAKKEFFRILEPLFQLWERGELPEQFPGLGTLIGNSDLRNTRNDGHLCTLKDSRPLKLREILEILDQGEIPSSWTRVVRRKS
ncbi:MAG: zinc dependent phospholipase C family protein [Spirochaetales bacterium]|nr:zinc dependent phospholipase C family protein [Spirochaetales bacterium]